MNPSTIRRKAGRGRGSWICLLLPAAALLLASCSDDPASPHRLTIQDLVDAASPGDTVVIAPGVYTDLHDYTDFIGRKLKVACVVKPGVFIRGATGDPADVVIDARGEGKGFWFYQAGDSTGLAAVTVRNATWGVTGYDASPRIDRCVLEDNGDVERSPSSAGTGMYFDRCSSLVTDCVFRRNQAASGAGACFSTRSDVRLERCIFEDNHAIHDGGGLVVANNSRAILVDCTLTGNDAPKGGAIYTYGDSMTVSGGAISNNSASEAGGGCSVDLAGTARFEGVTIRDNSAPEGAQGHVSYYGSATVACCDTDPAGWTGEVTFDDSGCR